MLDVDEPVYGEVGKEMARAGLAGWLTPHYNGAIWFDKPPLFYWLTALSMRLFGVSEFTARLPSALLSVALVAATYALAKRTFPRLPQAGAWAGFVLATTVQFFMLSRAAVTDMTLACTLTMALSTVYVWVKTNRGRWMIVTGLMTGLATLDKGPVAIVLIGLQVVFFLVWTRQAKRLLSPALWGGFALCLLVALPWYLLMIHLHGQEFIEGFLEANNATRFLKAEHKETQNALFYVPVFCGFFLPWTLALPGTVVATAQTFRAERQASGNPRPALFLLLWCVLVFGFFSASQTKLITYIFPLFPAAAILVGVAIAERVQAKRRDKTAWAFSAFLALLAVLLDAAGRKYGVAPVTLGLWTVVLLGGAVLAVTLPPSRGRWAVPGLAMALMLLIAWASPAWKTASAEVSDKAAAQIMARAAVAGEALYALGMKHTSLVFYSGRRVLYGDDRDAAMRDMAAHPEHVYALGPKVLDDLRDKYGLRDYRVLYANKHLTVIQAMPTQGK